MHAWEAWRAVPRPAQAHALLCCNGERRKPHRGGNGGAYDGATRLDGAFSRGGGGNDYGAYDGASSYRATWCSGSVVLGLECAMPASADIHAHHAAFASTLAALGSMGRAPSHCMDVERIFICTLATEWRGLSCGHLASAADVSVRDNISAIVAAVSRWRRVVGSADAPEPAYAVTGRVDCRIEVGSKGQAVWGGRARGPPATTGVCRGGRALHLAIVPQRRGRTTAWHRRRCKPAPHGPRIFHRRPRRGTGGRATASLCSYGWASSLPRRDARAFCQPQMAGRDSSSCAAPTLSFLRSCGWAEPGTYVARPSLRQFGSTGPTSLRTFHLTRHAGAADAAGAAGELHASSRRWKRPPSRTPRRRPPHPLSASSRRWQLSPWSAPRLRSPPPPTASPRRQQLFSSRAPRLRSTHSPTALSRQRQLPPSSMPRRRPPPSPPAWSRLLRLPPSPAPRQRPTHPLTRAPHWRPSPPPTASPRQRQLPPSRKPRLRPPPSQTASSRRRQLSLSRAPRQRPPPPPTASSRLRRLSPSSAPRRRPPHFPWASSRQRPRSLSRAPRRRPPHLLTASSRRRQLPRSRATSVPAAPPQGVVLSATALSVACARSALATPPNSVETLAATPSLCCARHVGAHSTLRQRRYLCSSSPSRTASAPGAPSESVVTSAATLVAVHSVGATRRRPPPPAPYATGHARLGHEVGVDARLHAPSFIPFPDLLVVAAHVGRDPLPIDRGGCS
jgi:hypothetical protein